MIKPINPLRQQDKTMKKSAVILKQAQANAVSKA